MPKLLLIYVDSPVTSTNVTISNKIFNYKQVVMPPLTLAAVAAVTPRHWEVDIVDTCVDEIPYSNNYDVVGFSTLTTAAKKAYEISAKFKEVSPHTKRVFGGAHATVVPEQVIKHCDSIVIGEAEHSWPQLLEDFENNKLKRIYKSETFSEFDQIPTPRWELIDLSKYFCHMVQTSRGCPHDCEFCSAKLISGRKIRYKPISKIIEEIKLLIRLGGKKLISIADDNLTANKKRAMELFKALIPLKVEFAVPCSMHVGRDLELLKMAKKAGVKHICIGFESISQKCLDGVGKGSVNKVSDYVQVIRNIYDHGIAISTGLMVGLDGETEGYFEELFQFIQQNRLTYPQVSILTPYPGTQVRKRLEKENRILSDEWENYTFYHINFTTKNMPTSKFYQEYLNLVRKIWSSKNVFERLKYLSKKCGIETDCILNILKTYTARVYIALKLRYYLKKQNEDLESDTKRFLRTVICRLLLSRLTMECLIYSLDVHLFYEELIKSHMARKI